MKKLTTLLFTIIASSALLMAQENYPLYKFTSRADAEKVLRVLQSDLKLNADQYKAVQELLFNSAKSQQELYAMEQNKDPKMVEMIVLRNTRHIEANLQNILGEDLFKIYNLKKNDIIKKLQEPSK
ncbi:MAG: hypothetical protein NZM35_07695 [Chitinophagales bacterium]|nr:hypothetical protein [Chitinophagales bacterium]MDW8419829.1 hypothetical protein [Chitinophagales bacterium]